MARRRRNTYRFRACPRRGVSPQIICASGYTPEQAAAALHRSGWTAVQRIERSSFRFDDAAIAAAKQKLDLKWPVYIRTHGRESALQGQHQTRKGFTGFPEHHILVKSYLDPAEASRVLWHELGHAVQDEAAVAAAAVTCWADIRDAINGKVKKNSRYQSRPSEVEARKYERMAETCPLAK